MVFTLHRYVFRELLKVFVLATIALTLIITLGSILRPVQEYGVGPRQVVHFIGYFMPIALTFVLPMAALFAAALVYGRLASDNELDACRASGIHLLTLVYPGLALAVVVAIANLILSFYMVPAFVQRAEKSLKADAKQILFRNIQRRGYYEPPDGRYLIYAEQANSQTDTLLGVVVTELKDNDIKKVITAESAKVHFNTHEIFNEVQVIAHNTYQVGSEDEEGFSAEWLTVSKEFPSMLGDDIKFKKIDEMKRIRADLIRFYPVAKLARESYAQFTAELLAEDIADKIASDANSFYRLNSGRKLIEFTAGQCIARDEQEVELSGDVVVIESNATIEPDEVRKQQLWTLRCKRALLHVEFEESAPTLTPTSPPFLTITMDMYYPTWQRLDGSEGSRTRHIVRGLLVPRAVIDKFAKDDVLKTVSSASVSSALAKGPSQKLRSLQYALQRTMDKTLAEIEAEMHSRLVFGVGCMPMILIGIGLGIIKKGGHLLSAFGASCIPAAVLIVCIMMGKNVTKNPGSQVFSGLILMWGALVFLSLLGLGIYRRLLKH